MRKKSLHKKTLIIYLILLNGFIIKSQTCNYHSSISDDCNMLGEGNYVSTTVDLNVCANKEWEVVFEDNFDGNSIDYIDKWVHHLGDGNGTRDNNAIDYHLLDENIEVNNGTAKLITRQENIEAHALTYCQNGSSDIDNCIQNDGIKNKRIFNFTSGVLWTDKTFDIGKIEIRCKLPNIDGLWPAFWLYGVGQCVQEIDVFEFANESYSESASISNSRPIMTYHRNIDCAGNIPCPSDLSITYPQGTGQTYISCIDYSKDFHIFSLEWDAYQITWKIDGVTRRVIYGLATQLGQSVDECNLLSNTAYLWNTNMPLAVNPMHMSIGVGVKKFDPPDPLFRGTYPAVMEVDYVRAYKRVPIPECDATSDLIIFGTDDGGTVNISTIPQVNYMPNETIAAKNTIVTVGHVIPMPGQTWRANSITLTPGFETLPGTEWTAESGDCIELFGRLASQDTSGSGGGKTKGKKTDTTQIAGNVRASVNEETKENKSQVPNSKSQVPSPKSPSPISITPNPSADGKFNLYCAMQEVGCMEAEISVMNALGQTITKEPMNRYPFPISIDLSSQPKGTYFIKIQNAERVFVEKVVSQ